MFPVILPIRMLYTSGSFTNPITLHWAVDRRPKLFTSVSMYWDERFRFTPHFGLCEACSGTARAWLDMRFVLEIARIRAAACNACIPNNVPMPTPKAFPIRSAISGDSAALSFTRSEIVARRTRRIRAVSATLSPGSSITSNRMNLPGCEGVILPPVSVAWSPYPVPRM